MTDSKPQSSYEKKYTLIGAGLIIAIIILMSGLFG